MINTLGACLLRTGIEVDREVIDEIRLLIDHTNLKPASTIEDLERTCRETLKYGFYGCCIPPWFVPKARSILGENARVVTVVGFPLGYDPLPAKLAAVENVIREGADEVDVVMNVSAFKSGERRYVSEEIKILSEKVHSEGKIIKVIIETGLLTRDEIVEAAALAARSGADFVKTSTGFGPRGAWPEDILLIRRGAPGVKVKAAGGIRTGVQAYMFYRLGVDRIGTSSGPRIIDHLEWIAGSRI